MNPHEKAADQISRLLIQKIRQTGRRYIISIAGESGCGKTETGKALVSALGNKNIKAIVLGQDNYFVLPPAANDAQRKKDAAWLGPHKEVRMELMEEHITEARKGASSLKIPFIEYHTSEETFQAIELEDIQVVIAEGTYTSLLRNVDTRIFIDEDYRETLKFRKKRNRGNEVNDPFVEHILETEHKIIAGHKYQADIIITRDYDVVYFHPS